MRVRQLHHFIAVAEELHFARAAERIGIEQSPLSRSIKALERELNVRLFSRNSRSTRLTRAGATFLDHARRIVVELEKARSDVRAAACGATARLRVGVSVGVSEIRLTGLIARLGAENPQIDLQVVEKLLSEQVRELRDGSLDIGLGPDGPQAEVLDGQRLWDSPLVVVLPSHHLLADETNLTLKQVLREPRVGCHPDLSFALKSFARLAEPNADLDARLNVSADLDVLLMVSVANRGVAVVLAGQIDTLSRSEALVRPLESGSLIVSTRIRWRDDLPPESVHRVLACARKFG